MLSATSKSLDYLAPFECLDHRKHTFVQMSGYGRLRQYVNCGNTTQKLDPAEALYGYEPWRLRRLRALRQK